jgi:hypothetical protein
MRLERRVQLALLSLAFVVPGAAQAANVIVVEARGVALKPGQTLDDTKPLMLKEGQHVTLISPNGATFKLDGPYNKPPAADQNAGVPIGTRLAALVTQNTARTGEVGTTRGTTPLAKLPDPWLFDISRNGTVCLREGAMPVFWRPDASKPATLTVMPGDRSWKAEAKWPAGTDRIMVATNVPIHGDATYLVSLDNAQAALTVSDVPAVLNNDSMRAAWMAEKGCDAQAEALLRPQQ